MYARLLSRTSASDVIRFFRIGQRHLLLQSDDLSLILQRTVAGHSGFFRTCRGAGRIYNLILQTLSPVQQAQILIFASFQWAERVSTCDVCQYSVLSK